MNSAMPLITDETIRAEAKALVAQEARHSTAHLRHVWALCKQYPELDGLLPELNDAWNTLYQRRSLRSNLAIVANIELMFTPLAKINIENREEFFAEGDQHVASLFLWHCMEEMEHRSSAWTVYNELFSNSWYRLLQWPALKKHMNAQQQIMAKYFSQVTTNMVGKPLSNRTKKKTVSRKDKLAKAYSVLRTQMPLYNPNNEVLPDFALDWFKREAAGEDMTRFYGKKSSKVSN